jgi:hypothetical protein
MDSVVSPKVKTIEGEGVGMHSLVCNTSGVERRVKAPKWGLRKLTSTLGEATTFPLIVYFVLGHGTNTQMSFCPWTPKIVTLGILGDP